MKFIHLSDLHLGKRVNEYSMLEDQEYILKKIINHIYFIFSLIVSKIAKTGCFSQLFLSTHNLDFLKYLNRLNSYHLDENGKQAADSKAYFLIERIGNHSSIQALPK